LYVYEISLHKYDRTQNSDTILFSRHFLYITKDNKNMKLTVICVGLHPKINKKIKTYHKRKCWTFHDFCEPKYQIYSYFIFGCCP